MAGASALLRTHVGLSKCTLGSNGNNASCYAKLRINSVMSGSTIHLLLVLLFFSSFFKMLLDTFSCVFRGFG